MWSIVRCAVLVTALVAGGLAAPAGAGEARDRSIVVRVLDTAEKPVDARVFVVGTNQGQSFQWLTEAGLARFTLVPGRYWIAVEALGYETVRHAVDVQDGDPAREVVYHLAQLAKIGSVRSRVDLNVAVSSVSSPSRRLAYDLAEALSSVAGVSASGTGGGLGLHVSLQGQDESLSHFQFGSAPVSANAAALAINTDLVQSVQVDQSRELVQFVGLGPTPNAAARFRARLGSYGSVLESASFQDSFGQTGIAVLHTLRAEESALNGSVYRDTSGSAYRHVGALHTAGDYLSVSGPIGSWAGSAVGAFSTSRASPLSTYLSGGTPVGTGPGEFQMKSARNTAFSLNGAVRSNSVALTYAQFGAETSDVQALRVVDSAVFPFGLQQRSDVQTFSLSAERALTAKVTAQASIQVFNERSAAALLGAGSSVSEHVYDALLELRSPDHEQWSLTYKSGRVDGLTHASVVGRTTRRVGNNVRLTGVVSDGTIAQQGDDARRARGWVDTYAADFDCANGIIVTQGPGDAAATPHELRFYTSATFDTRAVRGSVAAWHTTTRGQLLTGALVPLRDVEPSLPPGYVTELLDKAASPSRCGGPHSTPYALFARRDIAGQSVTTQGVTLALAADRGVTHGEFSLDLVSSRLDRLDPRMRDPLSIYIAGAQLAGVPFVRGTLVLNRPFTSNAEGLVSVHYESANNQYNLSPFLTTSVGIARRLRPGASLTIVAGNLLNTDAGVFVSSRYARALRTEDGTLLRGVAAPLRPFRVSAQLDLSLGK